MTALPMERMAGVRGWLGWGTWWSQCPEERAVGGAVIESLRACCVEYCFPGSVCNRHSVGGSLGGPVFPRGEGGTQRVVSQVGFVDRLIGLNKGLESRGEQSMV